jgi:hypothetical protein
VKSLVLVLAFASLATGAHAQDARLARLPADARNVVGEVIDSARVAGLPHEPLVQKALEGLSKGADGARIVGAVQRLADRLRMARATLGDGASETELVSAAAALYAGVEPDAIRRLTRPSPGASLALRLVVLADLIYLGVAHDTAAARINDLVTAGVRDEDYVTLRDRVRDDVRGGAEPGPATTLRVRALLTRSGG